VSVFACSVKELGKDLGGSGTNLTTKRSESGHSMAATSELDTRNPTLRHYWLYLGYSPQETKKALQKCREGHRFQDNMRLSCWARDEAVAYILILKSGSLLLLLCKFLCRC
jgi:hypothetical protein